MSDSTDTTDESETESEAEPPERVDAEGPVPEEENPFEGEGVPPGFEADWDVDDTFQEQGLQIIEVEGMGKATAELVDFGTIFDAQQNTGRSGEEATLTPDLIAKIIRTHYESPSFEGLTSQDVRSMKPSMPGALLDAISDDDVAVEMNADGSASVSVDEGKSSA